MTLEEYIDRLKNSLPNIIEQSQEVMEIATLDARAIIVNRVQNQGLDKQYSSKKNIPAFLIVGKNFERANNVTKAKSFLKEKTKKKELTNWKEFRQNQGLPTDKVNLTFSGEMFRNFKTVQVYTNGTRIVAVVRGGNNDTKEKLKWNNRRYGNYLKPTLEEREMIIRAIAPKLKKIVLLNMKKS